MKYRNETRIINFEDQKSFYRLFNGKSGFEFRKDCCKENEFLVVK